MLLDEKGIEPLVSALHSEQLVTRQQAAAALAALALDNAKAQAMIATAGSVQPLTGVTCPWNTAAIWRVEWLKRTGFPSIGDGFNAGKGYSA